MCIYCDSCHLIQLLEIHQIKTQKLPKKMPFTSKSNKWDETVVSHDNKTLLEYSAHLFLFNLMGK